MRIGNFGAILLGIVCLVVTAFITVVIFGWTGPLDYLVRVIAQNTVYGALAAIGFLLLAVFCFTLVRFGPPQQVAVSASTKFGQIRISDKTIEGIVTRAGLAVEGIKELSPKVQPLPEGINVFVQTVVNPGVVIPRVVEELQGLIKADVEQFTGLRVAEVKVMVQGIDAPGALRVR